MGRKRIDLDVRLKRNSKINEVTGCFEWLGEKCQKGYGRIKIDGSNHRVHRVAYQIWKGNIGGGLFVCHSCDNPSCINPDHLFLGTPWDNNMDCYLKGRSKVMYRPGEENPSNKYKEDVILKALYYINKKRNDAIKEASGIYGIPVKILKDVLANRKWKKNEQIRKASREEE